MRLPLTQHQKKILDYLKKKISTDTVAPSLRTAAADLGISHAAVAQTLKTLEEKAYIKREGRYSRSIQLLDDCLDDLIEHRQKLVPVIGHITAGLPMYAQQEWGGKLVVDRQLFKGKNLFALTVTGDSMKDAGILDRDYAICTPRQYAVDNEIIVALIHNEEATIKRFFLHKDCIELRPENLEYSPQTYAFDDIMVQGKVIGIVRGPESVE